MSIKSKLNKNDQFTIAPIANIRTMFKEKFGIPRQSGLVAEAKGTIELIAPYNIPESLKDIENYDYLWITFGFNQNENGKWSPTVRPPRLGGNKRVGVFASRSPFRPNQLGLSLVKLEAVDHLKCTMIVSGVDIMDDTPIFDIRPYLPDTESHPDANNSWRKDLPHTTEMSISFSKMANDKLQLRSDNDDIKKLITELLRQDPRPGHLRTGGRDHLKNIFAMKLDDFDLKWKVNGKLIEVIDLANN